MIAAMVLVAGSAMAERIDKGEALKIASEFFGGAAAKAGRTTPSTAARTAVT